MINNFDELWAKMQTEFDKINQQFKQIDKRFEQIDKRFEQIDERFEQMDQIIEEYHHEILDIKNNTESEFAKVYKAMEEGFSKMDQRFAKIENKLDIITNTNLAQILNKLTETKEELSNKLDKHIEKNEFEHKKFDYQLADMELKYKYNN